MVTLKSLSYFIGGRTLYDDVNLAIKPDDKIGLIGLNGYGKSTLFGMIHGDIKPSHGSVKKGKDTTIGFLNQDLLSYKTDASIRDVAMQAFQEAIKLQQEIDTTLKAMEASYEDELVERLGRLQERFLEIGGYDMGTKTDQMLEKMGFKTSDLARPLSEFSGGWRMRVMFAKLLLEAPSLLLLDEPTNHLDIVAIQWVESYLRTYPHAVMIISHDKRFLNGSTHTTWEITQERIDVYAGNYDYYKREKEQRAITQERAYQNQQKEIKRQKTFINRFRAKSSKAASVQSRVKALNKMALVAPVQKERVSLRIGFPIGQKSGKEVANIDGVSKAFGDLSLLQNASAHIGRGDKIALIGTNGLGKSTVLKMIAGVLAPDEGEVVLGHNVTVGYHTQHQLEALNAEATVLQTLEEALPKAPHSTVRAILGAFLFKNDAVYKKIKVLSGGEKARVSLAKLFALGPNFLLLDEPTNHLDMVAIDLLAQALQHYEGTLLFVSHNRHLVQEAATDIWYLQDQQIKAFHGSYDEFIAAEQGAF